MCYYVYFLYEWVGVLYAPLTHSYRGSGSIIIKEGFKFLISPLLQTPPPSTDTHNHQARVVGTLLGGSLKTRWCSLVEGIACFFPTSFWACKAACSDKCLVWFFFFLHYPHPFVYSFPDWQTNSPDKDLLRVVSTLVAASYLTTSLSRQLSHLTCMQ